jgi:D-sedoheptulose 7-phosphate isomerase
MTLERLPTSRAHLDSLANGLDELRRELARLERWSDHLGAVLLGGGRLLAAGNGGSAAQAQHLTAELVGRFRDERPPLSAIALHAETSSLTAIGNDYGADEAYARQVRAHGRPGDVLLALSTSGTSANVVAAVEAANEMELATWALTGARSCPLVELCDDAVCVEGASPATVQECHLVALHVLCAGVDAHAASVTSTSAAELA